MILLVLIDTQTTIAKIFAVVGMVMAMKGGGEVGKLSQLISGIAEADKLFAGFYFTYAATPAAWKPAYVSFQGFQMFPALCRIGLEDWSIPEESCDGQLACLLSRSGNEFLKQFGYSDVNVAENAIVIVTRWMLYVCCAWFNFALGKVGLPFVVVFCLQMSVFIATALIVMGDTSITAIGCILYVGVIGVFISQGLPDLWNHTIKPMCCKDPADRPEDSLALPSRRDSKLVRRGRSVVRPGASLQSALHSAVEATLYEQPLAKIKLQSMGRSTNSASMVLAASTTSGAVDALAKKFFLLKSSMRARR